MHVFHYQRYQHYSVHVVVGTLSHDCGYNPIPCIVDMYGLQNISVSSPSYGGVLIGGDWINQANVTGVLVIIYSYPSDTAFYHKQDVLHNESNILYFCAYISNVPKCL